MVNPRQTIRTLRLARGWTQRDLAARIGASGQSVWFWENGRVEPNSRQLQSLSRVFRVSMDTIAFEKELALAERPSHEEP